MRELSPYEVNFLENVGRAMNVCQGYATGYPFSHDWRSLAVNILNGYWNDAKEMKLLNEFYELEKMYFGERLIE